MLGETAGMSARMFIGGFSLRSSSSAISSSAASTGTSRTGASVDGPSFTEAAASEVTTWVLCPEAQFPARHNGCVCGGNRGGAERSLHGVDGRTPVEAVTAVRMAEPMRRDRLRQPGSARRGFGRNAEAGS